MERFLSASPFNPSFPSLKCVCESMGGVMRDGQSNNPLSSSSFFSSILYSSSPVPFPITTHTTPSISYRTQARLSKWLCRSNQPWQAYIEFCQCFSPCNYGVLLRLWVIPGADTFPPSCSCVSIRQSVVISNWLLLVSFLYDCMSIKISSDYDNNSTNRKFLIILSGILVTSSVSSS